MLRFLIAEAPGRTELVIAIYAEKGTKYRIFNEP